MFFCHFFFFFISIFHKHSNRTKAACLPLFSQPALKKKKKKGISAPANKASVFKLVPFRPNHIVFFLLELRVNIDWHSAHVLAWLWPHSLFSHFSGLFYTYLVTECLNQKEKFFKLQLPIGLYLLSPNKFLLHLKWKRNIPTFPQKYGRNIYFLWETKM